MYRRRSMICQDFGKWEFRFMAGAWWGLRFEHSPTRIWLALGPLRFTFERNVE
jgi:hypothetical protein